MNHHVHISAMQALITFLLMVVAFGTGHLLAASTPHNKLSQWWLGLGF